MGVGFVTLDRSNTVKRKAGLANERGGLMASIGPFITGLRFVEMDEVLRVPFAICVFLTDIRPTVVV